MNLGLAILVLGGGVSLMWTGIRDPKGGMFGAMKAVLKGERPETAQRNNTLASLGEGAAWYLGNSGTGGSSPMPEVTPDGGTGVAPVGTGSANRIVQEAATWLGTPYKWGGRTKGGADCSGYTQAVYQKAAGIEIGSWTGEQMMRGTQIPASAAGPGDLVFWGAPPGHHVGIVVDRAGGTMIHAPRPGTVVRYERITSSVVPGQPMTYRRYTNPRAGVA